MLPAMIIIIIGIKPLIVLIYSQVILCFCLPQAIIPMLMITRHRKLIGALVNKTLTNIIGWTITSIIITLNAVLLYLTFTGNL